MNEKKTILLRSTPSIGPGPISVGVVGGGMVGQATARTWMEWADVKIYDTAPSRRTHAIDEVSRCDFVFICLPTPSMPGGACDVSAIVNYFSELVTFGRDTVFVLKSTVPPGTTRKLYEIVRTGNIVHSPEFLTARCSLVDAQTPARNIVGAPRDCDAWAANRLALLYEWRFPGIPVHMMRSDESELVKLAVNGFFATKVAYFNEINLLAERLGCDWEKVIAGIMSDGRIAHAHTMVPGPSGEYGFGGACLPKDLSSLGDTMIRAGIEPQIPIAVRDRNCEHRKRN